jgi:uncharacterized YccA/Bax inhibitor family protein
MTIRRPNPLLEKAFKEKEGRPYAPMQSPVPAPGAVYSDAPTVGITTGSGSSSMTLDGTVHKTGFLLALLASSAALLYVGPVGLVNTVLSMLPVLVLATIGLAIGVARKPHLAAKLAVIYAVLEGLLLGAISKLFESEYPGIASQALLLTFGVAAAMLMLYRSGRIKVTQNFRIAVVSATLGVALVYLVSFIGRFVGFEVPFLHENSAAGILVSVVIVGLAAANLALDFDFIERGVETGLPRDYEWVGAFGLVVTLAWLYIEILRLLAKLRSRD